MNMASFAIYNEDVATFIIIKTLSSEWRREKQLYVNLVAKFKFNNQTKQV